MKLLAPSLLPFVLAALASSPADADARRSLSAAARRSPAPVEAIEIEIAPRSAHSALGRFHNVTSPAVDVSLADAHQVRARHLFPQHKRAAGWTLKKNYTGSAFWNSWYYGTDSGANGGLAQYIDQAAAESMGLLYTNSNGSVHIGVETTKSVSNLRKSTVLYSHDTITPGSLLLFDASHMPVGCGTWPAFWTVGTGKSWPQGGEIDIIEGVSEFTQNAISIHTAAGCSIPSSGYYSATFMDTNPSTKTNCDADKTNDQGCGMRDSDKSSYGTAFNAQGGGVYAMEWTAAGIKVWFFGRHSIPQDIKNGKPNPTGWGKPRMDFSSQNCNMYNAFSPQQLVISSNLGGTWPEGVWSVPAQYANQNKSCQAITGTSINNHILYNGAAFNEAHWTVNSISIFTNN